MRVAIVHDCLTVLGGAEKALCEILTLFPEADLFSVIDFFPKNERVHLLGKTARTTFIQHLPFAKQLYRHYLPLMPLAIEQIDLTGYDLVISSSYAVAKGVLPAPSRLHVCYCYSPMRYAWDLQHDYLKQMPRLLRPPAAWMLHRLRTWDVRNSLGVDSFVAISSFIAERIQKIYRREATVIYPPVDVSGFTLQEQKEDFYLTLSRLVPYKRVDLLVDAFREMPQKRLVVIGEGPQLKELRKKRLKNVTFLGHLPFEEAKGYLQRARAFLFAAQEDFGISPLEAQSCGTPVIAYGKGGALETIRGLDDPSPTGCFFKEQTVQSLKEAIQTFEGRTFSPAACRANSERFSIPRFREQFKQFIYQEVQKI